MLYYRCPDGTVVDELDLPDVLERYYTREDFENEVDRIDGSITICGSTFSASRILRELDPDLYDSAYGEAIDSNTEELMEENGIEEIFPGDEGYPEGVA